MTQNGCKKLEKAMTRIIGQITVTAAVLIVATRAYKPKMGNQYVDYNSYPVEAANYMIKELDIENMRLYNEYNYGSYLLYRGIPVFIDSRADLYTPEFNKEHDVFKDFLEISGLNKPQDEKLPVEIYIENKLEEYKITHLIVYKDSKLRIFLNLSKDKDGNNKYKELYDDGKFCIYERTH